MEIDRKKLIGLLEAFVDTSELLQRELMLFQLLFYSACKSRGLTPEEGHQLADRGRIESEERIRQSSQADHQDLRAKLPQLIDLLASDQDAALQLLRKWTPKGRPN
jgi:hypothetical protein